MLPHAPPHAPALVLALALGSRAFPRCRATLPRRPRLRCAGCRGGAIERVDAAGAASAINVDGAEIHAHGHPKLEPPPQCPHLLFGHGTCTCAEIAPQLVQSTQCAQLIPLTECRPQPPDPIVAEEEVGQPIRVVYRKRYGAAYELLAACRIRGAYTVPAVLARGLVP